MEPVEAAWLEETSTAQVRTVVSGMAELSQKIFIALTAAVEAAAGMAAAQEPEIREAAADPLISQVTQDAP